MESNTCVEVDLECEPLYPPTFEQVFSRTLEPTCAAPGTQCHAREGSQGGLVLDDIDQAHEQLLSGGRVVPIEAACSPMIVRIETTGELQMPPRDRLSEGERCALIQWVTDGAER